MISADAQIIRELRSSVDLLKASGRTRRFRRFAHEAVGMARALFVLMPIIERLTAERERARDTALDVALCVARISAERDVLRKRLDAALAALASGAKGAA